MTDAVDHTPNRIHCWKLVGQWWWLWCQSVPNIGPESKICWSSHCMPYIWFVYISHACIPYSPLILWILPHNIMCAESLLATDGSYGATCIGFWCQRTRINWLRDDKPFVWFLYKSHACIPYSPLLLWSTPLIEITAESWYDNDGGYVADLYRVCWPKNKNQLIEGRFAICLISVQKSFLHSLLTTVAVDPTP